MITSRLADDHIREQCQDARMAKLSFLSRIHSSIAKCRGLGGRQVHGAPHVNSQNRHSRANLLQPLHSWHEWQGVGVRSRWPSLTDRVDLDKVPVRLVK